MILMLHILIALSSVVVAGLSYAKPSHTTVQTASGLALGTLASGTYLVVSERAPLMHACVSGLIYFSLVSFLVITGSRRLAHQNNR